MFKTTFISYIMVKQQVGILMHFFIGDKEMWKQMLTDGGLRPAATVRLFCLIIKLHCFP